MLRGDGDDDNDEPADGATEVPRPSRRRLVSCGVACGRRRGYTRPYDVVQSTAVVMSRAVSTFFLHDEKESGGTAIPLRQPVLDYQTFDTVDESRRKSTIFYWTAMMQQRSMRPCEPHGYNVPSISFTQQLINLCLGLDCF